MGKQTFDTNSGDLELESTEGEENVSKTEDLGTESTSSEEVEYYKKLTGREDIKNKIDFEKHYEGLKKLVGNQAIAEMRKKAEAYEKSQQEIGREANEFIASEEGKETMKEFETGAVVERVEKLEEEILESRFLKKNPEVEPYLDLVKAVSIKEGGISYEEAYSKYLKDLIVSKLEVDKTKETERSIGVESKSRLTPAISSAEISQLVEQVKKTDSTEAKQKLVEKTLGLSK